MSKLTETQKRILLEYDTGLTLNGKWTRFGKWHHDMPKHTHITTLRRLWADGLIEPAPTSIYDMPMMLTKTGLEVVRLLGGKITEINI